MLPVRRLQLAAQEGHALGFVYRSPRALRNPSPAAVRLALHPAADALRIEVIKARGGHGGSVLCPRYYDARLDGRADAMLYLTAQLPATIAPGGPPAGL